MSQYLKRLNETKRSYPFARWIDSVRAMEYALPLLQHPEWQFTVCYFIARLGGSPLVIDAIIDVLQHGGEAGTRVMAVAALSRIGDERAIKPLLTAYKHDHELDSGGWSASASAQEAIRCIQSRLEQRK